MLPYPQKFKISSGAGFASQELVAFDSALIAAGISNYNLLRVSSILPINCCQTEVLDKKEGSALLVAYGSTTTHVAGETIASAVGIGIPEDRNKVGVIMEFAGVCDAAFAAAQVEEMVAAAMKNHGIPYRDILVSSTEATASDEAYAAVISAVALW